jgi:beta propeller repeat protein
MKATGAAILAVSILSVIISTEGLAAIQVTNNDLDDFSPRLSGQNITWYMDDGRGVMTGYEIMFYDGSNIIPITHNDTRDWNARVSSSYVVWETWDGNDDEICLYDIASRSILQLTDDTLRSGVPKISEPYVVWFAFQGGGHRQVWLWDGSEKHYLGWGEYPNISGSKVAWSNPTGVCVYDIDTGITVQPPLGQTSRGPHIDGSKVVWEGWDGKDWEIFLYDIDRGLTQQLTFNNIDDTAPKVSGSSVTWHGADFMATEKEIFFYDGSTVRTIGTGLDPKIDGSNVVWHSEADGDYEIMWFDGWATHQLTNNNVKDVGPNIDELTIVWQGYDGHDWEIFRATIPEPASLLLFLGAAVALLRRHRH